MQFIRAKVIPILFLCSCLITLAHISQLNGWLPAWQLTEKPEYKLLQAPEAEVELSYLTLPITFSMTEMQQKVNEQIPRVLFDKPVMYQDRKVRVRVTRTGKARVKADKQGMIRGSVPIAFRADANREGFFKPALSTSGRLMAYVDIRLDVDKDWNPKITAKSRFKWRQRPVIEVFFRQIDVADIISAEIQSLLDTQTQQLVKKLDEQFQFRALAEKSWRTLHVAVPVDKLNRTWLTIEPTRAFLEPMEGDAYDLRAKLGLLAKVKLQQTEQAPSLTSNALPPLEKDLPQKRSFTVKLQSAYPYQLLEDRWIAEVESSQDTSVNSLEIYPSGNHIGVALDQTFNQSVWWKRVRAQSFSTAMPVVDRESWHLSIKDNQPTPPKLSFLHTLIEARPGKSDWVAAQGIKLKIEQDALKENLYAYINRPLGNGLMLWSDIDAVKLGPVYPDEMGFVINSTAQGQMRLLFGF